jgi:hypothetical protein
MTTTTDKTAEKVHPFEACGLGKAPFRLAGVKDTAAGKDGWGMVKAGSINGVEVMTKPGGTCAYCGHSIMILCDVVSADGKEFHVGTDCVALAGGNALKNVVDKEKRKINKLKKNRRDNAKIAELTAMLDNHSVCDVLANVPHPNKWRAEQGDTLLDWVEWMRKNAGVAGKLNALKKIKETLKK